MSEELAMPVRTIKRLPDVARNRRRNVIERVHDGFTASAPTAMMRHWLVCKK